jgi:methylglutaconyl-CoA hydratase
MSNETDNVILYEATDGIARLTMNRPEKRNALNGALITALKEGLQRASADETIRVVILTGAGADFCAGADLSELEKMAAVSVAENLADARSLMELFTLIRELRVPVIAAVCGRALAGGCGLALACDLVIAEQTARFGFPEVKIGFVPAMVMAILRRNLTEKKAFEFIALGGEVAAVEAVNVGLINRAAAANEFQSEVQSLAESLAKLSSSAIALCKSLLYAIDGLDFSAAVESGIDVNVTARMSPDCKKGVARFLRKE